MKNKHKTEKQKKLRCDGYTMMEAVIYTVILALIATLIVNSLIVATKAFGRRGVVNKINDSAITAMERVAREIKGAYDIDPSSVLGSHPGKLVLNTYAPDESPTTVTFDLDVNGNIRIAEGAEAAVQLNSSGIQITNLVFRVINNGATPVSKSVKVEMNVSGNYGDYQKTDKFYNTLVLRKSY